MENRQKRWVALAASLALAGMLTTFPDRALADPVVKAEKILFIPYWVAILVWLIAPVTTTIFAYFKKTPVKAIIKYSLFALIMQAAVVAAFFFSSLRDIETSVSTFIAFLIEIVPMCILAGYVAFMLADGLSKP
ncbi:hypothetical protein LDB30_06570 [Acidithiobacillus ferrooxidans]|jgi:hypothetical protein|nr:hypothetical protein LDB30_06570 [Acidithiobacillus ferrooxidans]